MNENTEKPDTGNAGQTAASAAAQPQNAAPATAQDVAALLGSDPSAAPGAGATAPAATSYDPAEAAKAAHRESVERGRLAAMAEEMKQLRAQNAKLQADLDAARTAKVRADPFDGLDTSDMDEGFKANVSGAIKQYGDAMRAEIGSELGQAAQIAEQSARRVLAEQQAARNTAELARRLDAELPPGFLRNTRAGGPLALAWQTYRDAIDPSTGYTRAAVMQHALSTGQLDPAVRVFRDFANEFGLLGQNPAAIPVAPPQGAAGTALPRTDAPRPLTEAEASAKWDEVSRLYDTGRIDRAERDKRHRAIMDAAMPVG